MQKVFHNWDIEWISGLAAHDLELLATSGNVIANFPKLNAVVSNAGIVKGLISLFGSFGQYLMSFEDIGSMSKDLSYRFKYLGEVTTEDFLRNIGFDTAKPDRHLTRWLKRMRAIDDDASLDKALDTISIIADIAKITRAKFDSAIYLFCADRNDVLESGGICGNYPKCELCPIAALCPRNMVAIVSPPHPGKKSQTLPPKHRQMTHPKPKPTPNTVWNTTYAGMSIEEVKNVNPFAVPSWLNQPFGVDGSRERRDGIVRLFASKTFVDNDRIKELGRNDGKYVAFRAIVHGYATWKSRLLLRSSKSIQ